MKKRSFHGFMRKSSLFVLLFFTVLNYSGFGQPPAKKQAKHTDQWPAKTVKKPVGKMPAKHALSGPDCITMKPYSWVPYTIAKQQLDYFNTYKLPEINTKSGVTQTNKFPLGGFLRMIDYFRSTFNGFSYMHVYIGICTGETSVPAGYNGKLILIFAPAKTPKVSSDMAYYILPKAFDPKIQNSLQIGVAEKDAWVKKFVDLNLTVDASDPDNQFPSQYANPHVPSETRWMTYCAEDLLELIEAKDCYSTPYDLSNNMNAYLASYTERGIQKSNGISDELVGHFKKRILIQFELIDNSGTEVRMDDFEDFLSLPDGSKNCPEFDIHDNGQLCPTYCP